jgi:hypothetical protein
MMHNILLTHALNMLHFGISNEQRTSNDAFAQRFDLFQELLENNKTFEANKNAMTNDKIEQVKCEFRNGKQQSSTDALIVALFGPEVGGLRADPGPNSPARPLRGPGRGWGSRSA